MDTGAVLGGTSLFFSILGIVYSAINHKHLRSKCCGKVYEVSIDIDPVETIKKEEAEKAEKEKAAKEKAEKEKAEKEKAEKEKAEKEKINKFVPKKFILTNLDP